MRITINAAVTQPKALTTYELTFEELYEELEKARGPGEKTESDLLVPVAEWHELYRTAGNVKTMSNVFAGDVDGKTEEEVEDLLDRLAPYNAMVYTTHSHKTERKNGLNCYRVLIKLDREYPKEQHEAVWHHINKILGGHLDPGARTPEQGYYLPSYPPDCEHFSEIVMQDGIALRVPEISTVATAPSPEQVAAVTYEKGPTAEIVGHHIGAWAIHQTDLQRKNVAQGAKALLAGRNKIPVGEGQRNTFLIRLAGYLARSFPRNDPEVVAAPFETVGWDLLNQDGKYPIEVFAEMIERMQASEIEKLEEIQKEREKKQADIIRRATGGKRDHLITEEEIAHLEEAFGYGWLEHVVAHHKRDLYYLRADGTYDPHPVMQHQLFIAAKNRLAVFGDLVEYTYEDNKGDEKRKTQNQFLEEYSWVVRNVAFDMAKPDGDWDAETETIYLPVAQPKVEPVYHEEVQAWFNLLDPFLLDMLAMMPRLSKMLPALVLTGGGNVGKTILAKGIGRVYGIDPLEGAAAFSSFNASMLTRQPIIFMDEKMDETYRREGTTMLRRFLTQDTRMLDEKYQARVELHGYLRIIVAANDIGVLATREEMTAVDRAAFSERIVHIDLDPGKEYMDAMAERVQATWLLQNKLPEHIRYLSEHWEIQHPGKRFAVESNMTELHTAMASQSGIAGDVSYWLLAFVANPGRVVSANLPAVMQDHELRISARALVEGWGHYLKDHKTPAPSQISKAVVSLSTGRRQKIRLKKGKAVDGYVIDPHLLREANKRFDLVPDFDAKFGLTNRDK